MDFTDFSEIMVEITGGQDPITSIKEVAFVLGRDEQTVYGYRKGSTQPNWDDACRLSCFLIKEHGYYKLGMQAMLVCMGGKSNGKVSDDLLSIYEAGTDVHRAFREKNHTDYVNALARMKKEIRDLEKEGEGL